MRGRDISATEAKPPRPQVRHERAELVRAWTPWVMLTVFVFVWGLPPVKAFLNSLFAPAFPISGLHNLIQKVPPVVPVPHPEAAVYTLNLLIDAQSIVVASTATRWFHHEGDILRYVFFHSIALACLVGLCVTMQACVWPFTLMVVH
jgi:L-lactate permease